VSRVQWPVALERNYYQLSYRIVENGDKTQHTIPSLREAVRTAGTSVKNVVWTGWSMFHQFTRPEIAPYVVIDTATDEEVEGIETSLIGETKMEATMPDVWRITADGRATIFRAYREDREVIPHLAKRGLTPGKFLSPRTLIRDLYELVTHAKELAKSFPNAQRVEFRCTWIGLVGRKIADFESGIDWNDYICRTDARSSSATASIDDLAADTASVVQKLAAPVLSLFDGFEVSREWIIRETPKFRML
jgi:hypothetical protein